MNTIVPSLRAKPQPQFYLFMSASVLRGGGPSAGCAARCERCRMSKHRLCQRLVLSLISAKMIIIHMKICFYSYSLNIRRAASSSSAVCMREPSPASTPGRNMTNAALRLCSYKNITEGKKEKYMYNSAVSDLRPAPLPSAFTGVTAA